MNFSNFLGLIYYITDYAIKILKLIYHYFSIVAALLPSRQNSINKEEEDKESNLFKSKHFLTKYITK